MSYDDKKEKKKVLFLYANNEAQTEGNVNSSLVIWPLREEAISTCGQQNHHTERICISVFLPAPPFLFFLNFQNEGFRYHFQI